MERPTPRVNSTGLSQMGPGKVVRVIGKVVSLDGEHAKLELSDGGEVRVKLSRTANLADPYVEVIGKIDGEGSMTELSSCNMGSTIDMSLAEKVIELWAKHPDVFPSD